MTGSAHHVPHAVKSAVPGWRRGRWRQALAFAAPAIALAVATLPATSVAAAPATPRGPATVPPPPPGWRTVFKDNFNGPAGSKADSQWIYDTGPGSSFGTGEIERMTDSRRNVHLDGKGDLDITALGSGTTWTSGRIQTASPDVGAPAGGKLEVTALIRQPRGGLGYWPAFWMLGPGQWPETGEIDIMEDVNSLSKVSGTIHCGTYPGGPCHEGTGIGSGLRACGGCQSGDHTYTMILNRRRPSKESITFHLNGHKYFRVT
jgi:beta-glucanase (GH16 family)